MCPEAGGRGRPDAGFALVDLMLLIVVLGVVAASFSLFFARLNEQAARLVREQRALAVARGLIEEVTSMPFTYCDADDARARVATGAFVGGTGCAATVATLGPAPAGESRYGAANRFDTITDYQGFTMPGPGCAGLCDRSGALLDGPGSPLAGCRARVTLTPQALAGIPPLDANGQPRALRVEVRVDCGETNVTLHAVRTRHAPTTF